MMYIFPDVNDSSMIGFLRRKLAASTSPRRLPGQRFFVPMRQWSVIAVENGWYCTYAQIHWYRVYTCMYIYIHVYLHIYDSCIYSSHHCLFCVICLFTHVKRNAFHPGAILYFTATGGPPSQSAKPPQLMVLLPCVGYILLCVQNELEIPSKVAILFGSFTAVNISTRKLKHEKRAHNVCRSNDVEAHWIPKQLNAEIDYVN